MKKALKGMFSWMLVICLMMGFFVMTAGATGGSVVTDADNKTVTLDNVALTEPLVVEDGWTVIVNGDCSIAVTEGAAIESTGTVNIEGTGKLTLTGDHGIYAASAYIKDVDVNIDVLKYGVYASNANGDAYISLTNVDGYIAGDWSGVRIFGSKDDSTAAVTVENCNLKLESHRSSGYHSLCVYSGINVSTRTYADIEMSIDIKNSVVYASGQDAGISVNNYADQSTYADSRITITDSVVSSYGRSGTWAGIFSSVLAQDEDVDAIVEIKNSTVYSASPITGILTSSQLGVSKIILDDSVLGAGGKTALSMITDSAKVKAAELKNDSTYIQMTPDAILKGEIAEFDGKTIIATAGDGITYDAENNYFVIPQGSAVTETFTDGTVKEYTFNNRAGGVGGEGHEKEELWGYDVDEKKEIIIYTPEELVEFAKRTQPGGDLGNCEGWTIKLGADIDMSNYYWYHRNAEGTIVTDHRIPAFSGTFDGQGFAIKNMKYLDEYKEATEVVPLAFIIECHNAPAVLKNLKIDGITVNTVAPAQFAGLVDHFTYWQYKGEKGSISGITVSDIVVESEAPLTFGGMIHKTFGLYGEITDCHVKGFTVNAAGTLSTDSNGRCGGFLATGGEATTFVNCSVEDLVVNADSTGKYLGGFVGGASITGNYTNCSVKGFELNTQHKFLTVGGFVGYTDGSSWGNESKFINCDVTDLDITNKEVTYSTGGFIGCVNGYGKHTIKNCTVSGFLNTESLSGGFVGWLRGRTSGSSANFTNCSTAVNITSTAKAGPFAGDFTPAAGNVCPATFSNCTATGDVFAKESVGSFMDGDGSTVDGIKGGTYNYDPENVDSETGETNNVAPGYRALDNGDGTWTVFPDNGKEVVKVTFHRWNDELNAYEAWRTVEVFKDVDFFEAAYNNALNYSHPDYRFSNGIKELDNEADDKTDRKFSFWTDKPDGTDLVLDNEIEVVADMNVYAAYKPSHVCYIKETGVYYKTLADAVDKANGLDSATIVMIADIDFKADSNKKLEIKSNVTIVSEEGTNHVISRGAYTGIMFSVNKGKSLTLDGGLVIDGSNNWTFNKELYKQKLTECYRHGTSIYSEEYQANTPYYKAENTKLALEFFPGYENGTVATAFMITTSGGTVNLNDVTIQNNFSVNHGLVQTTAAGSTVKLEGAHITHVASSEGNGVVVKAENKSTINIKAGTVIEGCHVGSNHGLFKVYSGAVVNMSGGEIKNITGWNANGVAFGMWSNGERSVLNMTGGLITGCSSIYGPDNGRTAAVYLHNLSKMVMTGGTITGNSGMGCPGGIDSSRANSILIIGRADQKFDDDAWEESYAAAYNPDNHPFVVDNSSYFESKTDLYQHSALVNWKLTGGIYTSDVTLYCAPGYVCIPYEDTPRTDDYIVVPGFRVDYYSVTEEEVTGADGTVTTQLKTQLVETRFHLLKEGETLADLKAESITVQLDATSSISDWYEEAALENPYDFTIALTGNLSVYGAEEVTVDDGNTPGDATPNPKPGQDVPKTGDNEDLALALFGMMISIAAIVVLMKNKKFFA